MKDAILVKSLRVETRVGVPEEERSQPQLLEIDLLLEGSLGNLQDEIGRTTDYAAVCDLIRQKCGNSEYRLIETLAEEVAKEVLVAFPLVHAIEIELRKFILPETQYVGVRLRRER
jgi:FolB domain-containing protein